MFSYFNLLKKIDQNIDESGRVFLKKWASLYAPFDTALIKGNMDRALEIDKESVPLIRALVPHIQDEKLRETVSKLGDHNEQLAKTGFSLEDIDGTFQKSTGSLRNILQVVVDKVLKPLLNDVERLVPGLKLNV